MIRPEDVFGPPMAAPETRTMRRLRMAFIGMALVTSLAITLIDHLISLVGTVATGGIMLGLTILTAVTGAVFFRVKTRRDDHWIISRGFDRDGDGQ